MNRNLAGAVKWMVLRSALDSSQLVVVGNFDVTSQSATVTLPVAGTWYDYLNGNTFTATGGAQTITLQPGEFHIYLNRNLTNVVTTPVIDINNPGSALQLHVYPNPLESNSMVDIYIPERSNVNVELWNPQGQKVGAIFAGTLNKGKHTFSLSDKTNKLPAGIYMVRLQTRDNSRSVKLVLQ
jgi:hypothetical protein